MVSPFPSPSLLLRGQSIAVLLLYSVLLFISCHAQRFDCLEPSGDVTGATDVEAFRAAAAESDYICFEGGVFYLDSNYYTTTGGKEVPLDCGTHLGSYYDVCKDSILFFRERSNVVVVGSSSSSDEPTIFQLVNYDKAGLQDDTAVILIDNCFNVTVQDVTIRQGPDDLDHFMGQVREVRGENALVIQVPQQYLVDASYRDEDGHSIQVEESSCTNQEKVLMQQDVFFAEHFMQLDSNQKPMRWEKFVSDDGRHYDATDLGCSINKGCAERLVLVEFYWSSSSSCRVMDNTIQYNFHVGEYLLVLHQKRVTNGIHFRNVDTLNVRGLTVGNMAGEGISGNHLKNLHVDGLRAVSPENGWKTMNDVIWVRGYTGTNIIENVYLENLTDDYINFHTHAVKLDSSFITDNGSCVGIKSSPWWWHRGDPASCSQSGATACPSDVIDLYDETQSLIWQGNFLGRERVYLRDGSDVDVVCFEANANDSESLTNVLSRVVFATSTKWMPDETSLDYALTVRRITVLNSRSRALIQGSKTLFEDITVKDNMMSAILVTSGPDWAEGAPAANVTIRNGLFENVGINKGGFIAAIEVGARIYPSSSGIYGLDVISTAPIFRDVVIQDTIIRSPCQTGIFASGVKDLLLDNVVIEDAGQASLDFHHRYNNRGAARNIEKTFDNAESCQIFLFQSPDSTLYNLRRTDVCSFPFKVEVESPTTSTPPATEPTTTAATTTSSATTSATTSSATSAATTTAITTTTSATTTTASQTKPACPRTAQRNFTFARGKKVKSKSCEWLGKKVNRIQKFCSQNTADGIQKISDICLQECTACEDEPPSPTVPATTTTTTASTPSGATPTLPPFCSDTSEKPFTFLKRGKNKTKACKWLDKKPALSRKYCGRNNMSTETIFGLKLISDTCQQECAHLTNECIRR